MILRLFLYSSQPPWWYLGYPFTHQSLFGGPQSIPNHITFCFVVLRISLYRVSSQSTYWLRQSLYSSQSTLWLRPFQCSSQSPWWYSDYPYTHHRLPGGTQTIPLLIKVSLLALRLSLYSSQSTWCLRQSLYPSLSPWWYSDYPFTHHSLHCGTQTIPMLITVSLVVLRLSLNSPQ